MNNLRYITFFFIFYYTLVFQTTVFAVDINFSLAPDKRVFHIAQPNLSHLYIETLAKKVLVEAYQSIGIEVQFHSFPMLRAITLVNEDKLDAELARNPIIELEYKNLIRVNIPIFSDDIVVYSHDKTLKINSWDELTQYQSVILRGLIFIESRMLGSSVSRLSTLEQVFKKVHCERSDIAVELRSNRCLLAQLKLNNVHVLEPALERIDFYHYVNVKHKAIVRQLEVALSDMYITGRYHQLMTLANQEVKNRTQCQLLSP